ncbi:MAG: hypothetical protein ACP6IY_18950 [Promethearchaeia archaeon]
MIDKFFYRDQIEQYSKLIKDYRKLTHIVKKILIILLQRNDFEDKYVLMARVKSLSSFAEKIIRPDKKYKNPIKEITDLSGIRVILPTLEKQEQLISLIRKYFDIDEENTVDKRSKMGVNEFGYISFHLVVKLKKPQDGIDYYERVFGISTPKNVIDLKCEIQIRTFINHTWAINQHGIFYKGQFEPPEEYRRELTRIAAVLEKIDEDMDIIIKQLHDYETNYSAYMSKKKIQAEIERLEIVKEFVPNDINIGTRIGILSLVIENWDKAIDNLKRLINLPHFSKISIKKQAEIFKNLGIALCKKFNKSPMDSKFREGQEYIKKSIKIYKNDVDAHASLAGSYKKQGKDDLAIKKYKEALEIDPSHPYPLNNYLVYKLENTNNISKTIESMEDKIQKAMNRRSKQILVGVDIPWAFYDVGFFAFLLSVIKKELKYELFIDGFKNYLMSLRFSPSIWQIETSIQTLLRLLKTNDDSLNDIKLILLFLHLGILFHKEMTILRNRNQIKNQILKLDVIKREWIKHSINDDIVIIAGGTSSEFHRQQYEEIKNILIPAFKDFKGIIISGGTKAGVCQIAGDIKEAYPDKVHLIGYIPEKIPYNVEIDNRYDEIRKTKGNDFSILECLAYWYDMMHSGISPDKVKLIGINGGKISSLEFRIAIIFGAQVGILKESGGAATELIRDKWWFEINDFSEFVRNKEKIKRRLFKVVDNNEKSIKDFLTKPFIIDPDLENIHKILVYADDGFLILNIDFTKKQIDNLIFAGFLTALDNIGKMELGTGGILGIDFEDGYIGGQFIPDSSFKAIFLLKKSPSSTLKEKFNVFIKKIKENYIKIFQDLHNCSQSFTLNDDMINLLIQIFGDEFSKLLPINNT